MASPSVPSPASVRSPMSVGEVLSPPSVLSSIDSDQPYPRRWPKVGHAVILNNLEIRVPETVGDVEALESTLKKIGFQVKIYKDKNVQRIKQVKSAMTKAEKHAKVNCFLFAFICPAMEQGSLLDVEQGWMLDMEKRKEFTLAHLRTELGAVPTLQGKPKVLLIEDYGCGTYQSANFPTNIGNDDLYIVYASNSVSYRKRNQLSFLKTLTERLREHPTQSFAHIIRQIKLGLTASPDVNFPMARLEDDELSRLAPKISYQSMQSIAIQRLGFEDAEVSSLVAECHENTDKFNRQILLRRRNKNSEGSRQRLVDILQDSARRYGQVNIEAVDELLHVESKDELIIKVFDGFTQQLYFSEYSTKRRILAHSTPLPLQLQLPMLPPGDTTYSSSPTLPLGGLTNSSSATLPPGGTAYSSSPTLPLGGPTNSSSATLPPGGTAYFSPPTPPPGDATYSPSPMLPPGYTVRTQTPMLSSGSSAYSSSAMLATGSTTLFSSQMLSSGGSAVSLLPEPDIKRFRSSNSPTQPSPARHLGWTSRAPTNLAVNVSRGPPPPYVQSTSRPVDHSFLYQNYTGQEAGGSSQLMMPDIHPDIPVVRDPYISAPGSAWTEPHHVPNTPTPGQDSNLLDTIR